MSDELTTQEKQALDAIEAIADAWGVEVGMFDTVCWPADDPVAGVRHSDAPIRLAAQFRLRSFAAETIPERSLEAYLTIRCDVSARSAVSLAGLDDHIEHLRRAYDEYSRAMTIARNHCVEVEEL